jgi:hypothetical protein
MVKSRKKQSKSNINNSFRSKKIKNRSVFSGGGAFQTYGDTRYASSIASRSLREDRRLQDQFKDPEVIRGYLKDSRYGTKHGASSYTKIYNILLTIRKENIENIRAINQILSNYSKGSSNTTVLKAFGMIEKLYKMAIEERYQRIRMQESEIRTQFKKNNYEWNPKKEESENELGKGVHELRSVVLHAFYTLVKTENNDVYIIAGSVVKQSKGRFSEPGRSI